MQLFVYEEKKKQNRPTKYAHAHTSKTIREKKINVKPYKRYLSATMTMAMMPQLSPSLSLSPHSTFLTYSVHALQRWHTKNNFVFIYVSWMLSLTITSRSQCSLFFHFLIIFVFFICLIYCCASFSCMPYRYIDVYKFYW